MFRLGTSGHLLFYFSPAYNISVQEFSLLNKVGTIVLAYAFGLLLGTSGIFRKAAMDICLPFRAEQRSCS